MTEATTYLPARRPRVAALGPMPLLCALVAVDVLLIVVSVVRLVTIGDSLTDPWLLETDGGWPEYFGYAQQAVLALLLVTLAYVNRHAVWVAYAAIFLCALADDSLRLHENKGAWLVDRIDAHFGFPESVAGLRANDLGEIFVWGMLAVVPVAAAVLLHRRSDEANRQAGRTMAWLVAAYVFFGAVVDQVHVLFLGSWVGDVVGTVEDGGELVVLSATVVFVAGLVLAAGRRTPLTEGREAAAVEPSLTREEAPVA